MVSIRGINPNAFARGHNTMIGRTFVIIRDLGSLLKEGMVCQVYEESDKDFKINVLNPPTELFLTTYCVNGQLREYFFQIIPKPSL